MVLLAPLLAVEHRSPQRVSPKSRAFGPISASLRFLTMIATGRDLKDANVPYRLIKRSALQKALPSVPAEFDMQNVALTFALKRDPSLRWAYVPIKFRARQGGTNSINLPKIARMGWRMLLQINKVGR